MINKTNLKLQQAGKLAQVASASVVLSDSESANAGCRGACTTICTSCTGTCAGGESCDCLGTCCGHCFDGTCHGECGGCGNGCGSACSKSGAESCGCGNNCSTGCNTGCKDTCKTTCLNTCNNTCKDTCKDTCLDTCKDGCTGTCLASNVGKAYYNVLRGAGGIGIKLDVLINGEPNTILSLKGGNGAAASDGGHEHCGIIDKYDEYKHLLVESEGSSEDNIFKGIITDQGKFDDKSVKLDENGRLKLDTGEQVQFMHMKDMEAPANTGESDLKVEDVAAIRYNFNDGSAPDINNDTILYDGTAVIPMCGITNGDKTFKEWNTEWNGKGTAFNPGDTVDAATIFDEAGKQNIFSIKKRTILTLYAIWTGSTTLHP